MSVTPVALSRFLRLREQRSDVTASSSPGQAHFRAPAVAAAADVPLRTERPRLAPALYVPAADDRRWTCCSQFCDLDL